MARRLDPGDDDYASGYPLPEEDWNWPRATEPTHYTDEPPAPMWREEPSTTPTTGGGGAPSLPSFSVPKLPAYPEMPPVPVFTPPQFRAPDLAALQADPGYLARLGHGQRALEQSAAARGVLRTGGTLKDLVRYGQDLASQEYGNVYDRALDQYRTDYEGAYAAYQPQLVGWQTGVTGARQQWETQVNDTYNRFRDWLEAMQRQAGVPGV